MAECQLPKLDVAGSNPVGRSKNQGVTGSPVAPLPFWVPTKGWCHDRRLLGVDTGADRKAAGHEAGAARRALSLHVHVGEAESPSLASLSMRGVGAPRVAPPPYTPTSP